MTIRIRAARACSLAACFASICAFAVPAQDEPTAALLARIDRKSTSVHGFEIVHAYPHDPGAFTQGLLWAEEALYESTGQPGRSSVRRVDLETGEILKQTELSADYFGEGIAAWRDRLVQLTWRDGVGLVYNRRDLFRLSTFEIPHEGWGLTSDGRHLIVSDGTSLLRFWNPETFETTRTLEVRFGEDERLANLNELEWIDGEILANVWGTRLIARIDPETGRVRSWVDLSELPSGAAPGQRAEVLNGIAWDEKEQRLFVTGKFWPRLYEIRIVSGGLQ